MIKIIRVTPDAEKLIEQSARMCYNSECNDETREAFIKSLIKRGHESILEHACATFEITGVSRALTHQLVRHRIASFSQRSQRYVSEDNFETVTPKSLYKLPKHAQQRYFDLLASIRATYESLVHEGMPKEDARYVLPNACYTSIIMTMNFRELRHFLKLRTSEKAQWEIRDMANDILNIMSALAPSVFSDLQTTRKTTDAIKK